MPEKRKLLASICQEKTGCEISSFDLGEKNEIIVGDFTCVKKIQPTFKYSSSLKIISLAHVNNESKLYDVVHVCGFVFNLKEKNGRNKEGRSLLVKEGVLKDNTDSIPVTFFEDIARTVEIGKCYKIRNMRVSKYSNQRLLKSMDTTVLEVTEDLKNDELVDDDLISEVSTSKCKISGINLKSLDIQYKCSICKQIGKLEKNLLTCAYCDNVDSKDDTIKERNALVTFSMEDGTKVQLSVSHDILELCFNMSDDKMQTLQTIVNSHATISYNLLDSRVTSMTPVAANKDVTSSTQSSIDEDKTSSDANTNKDKTP